MGRKINFLNPILESKLSKNFSIYSLGRLIGALVSVTLLPLFTKQLPKTEFGIIGILWLVVPLMSRLINLGLDVAVSLKFFKLTHRELSLHLYNTLLGITLCGLAFLALGLWQMHWVRTILDSSMTRTTFSLLILAIVFSIYAGMMQGFIQLSGKAVQNVVVAILSPIIITGTTYILIMYVNKSYTSYVTGMAVGNGIFGIIGLIYFFTKYPMRYFYPSFSTIKQLLRVGLPTIPGTIGGISLASADRYVIKYFLGLEAVALYTYGYRFAEYILLIFFQPFQKALSPIILEKAAKNLDEASEYNSKIVSLSLTLFPLLISAVIIPFKDIMNWLGETSYDKSYLIFMISVFGILLYNTAQVNSILLNHLERTELDMLTVLLGTAVNIGLNIWLVPQYGIAAAAFTTIISYLFMLGLCIFIINHFTSNKISLLNILSKVVPFLIYLVAVFYVDTIKNTVWWQVYALKSGLFICLILTTWSIFSDVRHDILRILSRLSTTTRSQR